VPFARSVYGYAFDGEVIMVCDDAEQLGRKKFNGTKKAV
jgi:hypothetical protein